MVCSRCKMVVKSELEKLGLHPISVELGEVEIQEATIAPIKEDLVNVLESLGFELIGDKKNKIIEKTKTLIIDLVHHRNNDLTTNLSHYLANELQHDYNSLSNLFTEVEGTTIEKYFISQKIEKVKELLIYNEQSLSEIAFQLQYSSVAHLSNQFKKMTGFSPSYYKQQKDRKRKPIEDL